MYEVINLGYRLEIYVEEACANKLIELAFDLDIEAKIIGYVEEHDGEEVIIKTNSNTFQF